MVNGYGTSFGGEDSEWETADFERLKLLVEQIIPKIDKTKDGVCWHGLDCHNFPIKVILEKLHESYASILPKKISFGRLRYLLEATLLSGLQIWRS